MSDNQDKEETLASFQVMNAKTIAS